MVADVSAIGPLDHRSRRVVQSRDHADWHFALLGVISLSILLVYLVYWRSWPIDKWIGTILPPAATLGAPRKCDRHGKDRERKLSVRPVDHVICATDLQFGGPFFFSTADGGRLFSKQQGYAEAPDLSIIKAVRASAAFPPLIPPVSIRIYTAWAVDKEPMRTHFHARPLQLWFTDGGVFNNFGMEWQQVADELFSAQTSYAERFQHKLPEMEQDDPRLAWFMNRYGQVQLLVDASKAQEEMQTQPLGRPFVGFFRYFRRVMDVMYESTLAGRSRLPALVAWQRMNTYPAKWLARYKGDRLVKRACFDKFPDPFDPEDDRDLVEKGPLQLYVAHSQPFDHIHLYWGSGDLVVEYARKTARRDGDAAAAKAFGRYWPWTAGKNWRPRPAEDDVPTTLARLDGEWTLKLIIEGYVKTREMLFVMFGYQGPPLPTLCEFTRLLESDCKFVNRQDTKRPAWWRNPIFRHRDPG